MGRCVITTFAFDRNGNSRISVNAGHVRRRPPWGDALDVEGNHKAAVKALAKEFFWTQNFVSAYMPGNENKMVHIFDDRVSSESP